MRTVTRRANLPLPVARDSAGLPPGRGRATPSPRAIAGLISGVGSIVLGAGLAVAGGEPLPGERTVTAVVLVLAGIVVVGWALVVRAQAAAQQATATVIVLRGVSRRLGSGPMSPEAVGRILLEEAGRIVPVEIGSVLLRDADERLRTIASSAPFGRDDVPSGVASWVAANGIPVRTDDVRADPRASAGERALDTARSLVAAPMTHDGRAVGVLILAADGPARFDDADLALVAIIADQGAAAIHGARLLARSHELADELRGLLDMSSALSASLDPRAVANLIAEHLASALGADEVAVSTWDRTADAVRTLGYHPAVGDDDLEPVYSLQGYPMTRRVLEEQAVIHLDAEDPGADPAEVALLRAENLRSLIMLPLVAKGRAVGLVELMAVGPLDAGPDRIELARTIANEAAMALENARLYEEARRRADRDPLTGFVNHRYLHERLGEEIVRAGRTKQPLSLLMLDLDGFKLVNDTFGHLFGDRVLVHAASLVRDALRTSDVPARYGGDEFAAILPETDVDGARHVAERILAAFRDQPYRADGRLPVQLGTSIGIATHPGDARTATDLIGVADAALYRVKAAGGGLVLAGPARATEGGPERFGAD